MARRGAVLLLLVSLPAAAIPAFARRYKTSCITCHTLPPQLNPAGQAFRANGYRLPQGEPRRQEDDVQLGAPEWEALFPRSFLPGNVPEASPVAGLFRAAIESEKGQPESIELLLAALAGGNLGKRASWFAEAGFTNRGAGLSRAWVSVDATPWASVRAGQMEPGIVPWSRFSHRLTYDEYLPFETKVGLIELGAPRPAVEVAGAGSDPGPMRGLRYIVGIAAREQGGLAGDAYGRISYKFGGVAAAGDHGAGLAGPLTPPLAETSLQVGGFVYRASLGGPPNRSHALRGGADVTLLIGQIEAMAGGWVGNDDLLAGTSSSLLAGAMLRPWPWLALLARYETAQQAGSDAQQRLVAAVRAALQQNVQGTLEMKLEVPDANVGGVASVFVAL